MSKKLIGIFVCMLMLTTSIIPVMGELNILKNEDEYLPKNVNGIKTIISDNSTLKFMIAGKALRAIRSYWLHLPPSYDGSKPVPLVISFIYGDDYYPLYQLKHIRNNLMGLYTNFTKKADDEGFIVVYPNPKLWLETGFGPYGYLGKLFPILPCYGWDYGYLPYWPFKFIDDIGFIHDLIDKMKKDYNINASRIYATGFSCGARMSYSIGAYFSDTFAAIAPIDGSIGTRFGKQQHMYYISTPKNPVSVLAFIGQGDDGKEFWYNGTYVASVNESMSFWVENNGCDSTPEINISESGNIIRTNYTNGMNGTEVVLYEIVDGQHVWPGNPWDNPDCEISANDLIWEFFENHPKK